MDIEAPGVVQEPEGGIIFEAPNLVQEPGDGFSEVQDLVQEPENGFIAPEGARGMPQVSSTKPGGGGNPRFSNPFYDFGFLNKFLHPGRVMVGKKLFLYQKGLRG